MANAWREGKAHPLIFDVFWRGFAFLSEKPIKYREEMAAKEFKEMEERFKEVFREGINELRKRKPLNQNLRSLQPEGKKELTDVFDRGIFYEVAMELPRIKESEIKLKANEGSLEIRVPSIGFRKRVSFPATIDPRALTATYKNGVLFVRLRKSKL